MSSIPSADGKCYPRRALPSENPAITAAAPFLSHPNINFIRTVILLYGQKPIACERYFHTYHNHIHSLRRAAQPSSMATVISSAQCSFNGSGRTHPRILRYRQNFAQNDRTACPSVAGGGDDTPPIEGFGLYASFSGWYDSQMRPLIGRFPGNNSTCVLGLEAAFLQAPPLAHVGAGRFQIYRRRVRRRASSPSAATRTFSPVR